MGQAWGGEERTATAGEEMHSRLPRVPSAREQDETGRSDTATLSLYACSGCTQRCCCQVALLLCPCLPPGIRHTACCIRQTAYGNRHTTITTATENSRTHLIDMEPHVLVPPILEQLLILVLIPTDVNDVAILAWCVEEDHVDAHHARVKRERKNAEGQGGVSCSPPPGGGKVAAGKGQQGALA